MKPLQHLTILDLSRVLACPFASMILAELGATVIKVEQPGAGDETRGFEPRLATDSAYYFACNRSKASITVNLRSDAGRRIIRELAQQADVLGRAPSTTGSVPAARSVARRCGPRSDWVPRRRSAAWRSTGRPAICGRSSPRSGSTPSIASSRGASWSALRGSAWSWAPVARRGTTIQARVDAARFGSRAGARGLPGGPPAGESVLTGRWERR